MKLLALLAALSAAHPAGQARQDARPPQSARVPQAENVAEAYQQFLLAQRFEDDDNAEGAIAAYKRAMTLDPTSSAIVSALANLYMRTNRPVEASTFAEQALTLNGSDREAHRILGTVYASRVSGAGDSSRQPRTDQRENLDRAINHLERAVDRPVGVADAEVRALLARVYVAAERYDKAIPLLLELVKQEPQWQDGGLLLAEAYSAAGRTDEAITWLEQAVEDSPQLYPALADFYGRQRRWRDAAAAYARAVQMAPRSLDLRVRYASALLNQGGIGNAVKARDVLREALAGRANDERALFLLSQAERLSGDLDGAERTARRLIAQNGRSARAYVALAETLEERQRYQQVADALAPVVAQFRSSGNGSTALSMLLPHLGFSYQQLGQTEAAIALFEEARKLAPDDPSITAYLVQAQMAAKKYGAAAEVAHAARAAHPDEVRLARLEAQALRQSGKFDQGLAVLTDLMQRRGSDPSAHIALARFYADANRGPQAVKVLQDAEAKFPTDGAVAFELAGVFEKQKRYAESEATFRHLVTREPENAPALNYFGYMLAVRGERLAESVELVKRALQIEPENGSYLDSLGWAYYKSGKLDLALEPLQRAAEQLARNSVVQDHFGDLLFKLGRYGDAISAWTRAIGGDGDSVNRSDIDKKIKAARHKLPKK